MRKENKNTVRAYPTHKIKFILKVKTRNTILMVNSDDVTFVEIMGRTKNGTQEFYVPHGLLFTKYVVCLKNFTRVNFRLKDLYFSIKQAKQTPSSTPPSV